MHLFENIWSGKTSREREGAYRGLGLTQCPHADSPTDVRSPRQCGPRQTQANSNLVIVPPESDSLVTQVDIGGGWANGQVGHTGQNHSVTTVPYVLRRVFF